MIDLLLTRYNYLAAILLVAIGLYMLIQIKNLVFKVIGLNIFQTGIFLFFITTGFVAGGRPPVIGPGSDPYVSPLPHVLILTAIVVGVSLTAVALTLVVRIYAEYGTLQADVIQAVSADD